MKLKNIKLWALASLSSLLITSCDTASNQHDERVESLLSQMTLEEKIGQMNQLSFFEMSDDLIGSIKKGTVGSLLNIINPEEINKLQKVAMEESRLGIPMIIGRDVIHGFKTIFPIPLGQAASFNPEIVQKGAYVAATEARATGINWTFAPMLDISRDARWGRIAESLGEDTYLASVLGAAMVKGFQGNGDLKDANALAACAKHFVGYGAAEGGRDYNSTNIPPVQLFNTYLPPFHAAVDAGTATIMVSFNDNDGVPSSGNEYLLQDVLRKDWGFNGFVVSDWASITEMIAHGFAKDDKQAAEISANAGVDMEMVTGAYLKYLPELIKSGKVPMQVVDDAVRHILKVKIDMGLFENPYADTSKPLPFYTPEHLEVAKLAAMESAILLKNDKNILPLTENKKIAIIGPMADAAHDQLGTWVFDGDKNHTVTPIMALKNDYKNVKYTYEAGLNYSRDLNTANFDKAKRAAAAADVALVFLGEEAILSGEAHSLSNINLVGKQSELLKAVKSAGKPVVLIIMAGRPLTIERDLPYADAVLYNFHPGTMGGAAIMDLVFGKASPSGKLPVTFVREVGQIPMYYNHNNTGRPAGGGETLLNDIPQEAGQTSLGNTSFYIDSGKDALFPFGYGLSYTTFQYSDISLSATSITTTGSLTAKATLKNTGKADATEVVQLYIQDITGSVVRPVKELKGFNRVTLKAGESKTVEFTVDAKDLAFYNRQLQSVVEPGDFNLWIGGDSATELKASFTVVE